MNDYEKKILILEAKLEQLEKNHEAVLRSLRQSYPYHPWPYYIPSNPWKPYITWNTTNTAETWSGLGKDEQTNG